MLWDAGYSASNLVCGGQSFGECVSGLIKSGGSKISSTSSTSSTSLKSSTSSSSSTSSHSSTSTSSTSSHQAGTTTTGKVPATTGQDTATYTIIVEITLSINLPSNLVDLSSFVTNLANALSIPANAIQQVEIDLDLSQSSSTVVTFALVNYEEVNPLLSAQDLQNLISTDSPILKKNGLPPMSLIEVTSQPATAPSSQSSSKNAVVIAISVAAGACVLLAVAIVVSVFYWKRRRDYTNKEVTATQIGAIVNSSLSSRA